MKFHSSSYERQIDWKKQRLCSEALHISENQIQIEPFKGSETFGKLSLTCPSAIKYIVLLTQKTFPLFAPKMQCD